MCSLLALFDSETHLGTIFELTCSVHTLSILHHSFHHTISVYITTDQQSVMRIKVVQSTLPRTGFAWYAQSESDRPSRLAESIEQGHTFGAMDDACAALTVFVSMRLHMIPIVGTLPQAIHLRIRGAS